MTKLEYLKKLKRALRQVKTGERNKSLAYFSECIDDRMEDGVPEQDAVAELESVEAAAERIIAEAEASGQLKPRRSVWEVALIVLGFPLWFPILLLIVILALTFYALAWVVLGVLFLLSVVLVLGGAAGVFSLFALLGANPTAAFASLAVGLAGAGLGLALLVPLLYIAKAYIKVTSIIWNKLTGRKEGFQSWATT